MKLQPEACSVGMTYFGESLYLRVSPKGRRAWVCRLRHGYKDKWITLGTYPEKSVDEAKRETKHIKSKAKSKLYVSLKTNAESLDLSQDDIISMANPRPMCGVYFLISNGEVVYVGKSTNLLCRLGKHAHKKDYDSYTVLLCSVEQLDELETKYILKFKPHRNLKLVSEFTGVAKRHLLPS